MQGNRKPLLVWLTLSAALVSRALPCRGEEATDSTRVAVQKADSPAEKQSDSAPKPAATDSASPPHIEGGQVNGRWREGSRLVDQMGSFKLAGDRVTFISSDGKLKFDGLENLAIERVA